MKITLIKNCNFKKIWLRCWLQASVLRKQWFLIEHRGQKCFLETNFDQNNSKVWNIGFYFLKRSNIEFRSLDPNDLIWTFSNSSNILGIKIHSATVSRKFVLFEKKVIVPISAIPTILMALKSKIMNLKLFKGTVWRFLLNRKPDFFYLPNRNPTLRYQKG